MPKETEHNMPLEANRILNKIKVEYRETAKITFLDISSQKHKLKIDWGQVHFERDTIIGFPFLFPLAWEGPGSKLLILMAAMGVLFMVIAHIKSLLDQDGADAYKNSAATLSLLTSLGFAISAFANFLGPFLSFIA